MRRTSIVLVLLIAFCVSGCTFYESQGRNGSIWLGIDPFRHDNLSLDDPETIQFSDLPDA